MGWGGYEGVCGDSGTGRVGPAANVYRIVRTAAESRCQSPLSIIIATACFAHTGRDGTTSGISECFAISTAEKARLA